MVDRHILNALLLGLLSRPLPGMKFPQDCFILAILLSVLIQDLECDFGTTAYDNHDVQLLELGWCEVGVEGGEGAVVRCRYADGTSRFHHYTLIIRKAHGSHSSFRIAQHTVRDLGSLSPLECLLRYLRSAETRRYARDRIHPGQLFFLQTVRQRFRSFCLYRQHLDRLSPASQPSVPVQRSHHPCEKAPSSNTAHDGIVSPHPLHLRLQLLDQRPVALPDIWVVKWRHVHAVRIVSQQLRPHVRVGLAPVPAVGAHVGAHVAEFLDHECGGVDGYDDSSRTMQGQGGGGAGQPGVAAAGAVEVDGFLRAVGLDGTRQEVADAAGLEGRGGLEVFEFEVDIAGED